MYSEVKFRGEKNQECSANVQCIKSSLSKNRISEVPTPSWIFQNCILVRAIFFLLPSLDLAFAWQARFGIGCVGRPCR